MNDFGMDADSNSWGSDYDQGDDYGSDYSDGEYQPSGSVASSSAQQHHQQPNHHHPGPAASRATKSNKNSAQARKMVNRGRWTKEEVSFPPLFFLFLFILLLHAKGHFIHRHVSFLLFSF